MATVLTLGPVQFEDFEVPSSLTDLGGEHKIATHSFPGGYQTQQAFGAFPVPLTWEGHMTGTTAMFRKNELDRIRVAGREVVLSFGDKIFLGLVQTCRITVRHEWLVNYQIVFVPRVDVSSGAGPSDLLSAFDMINSVLVDLSDVIAFFSLITSDGSRFSMPPILFPLAVTLFSTTTLAVSASFGVVSDIPVDQAATIYAAAQALLAAAQPLTADPNPSVASPSLDLVGYASSIVNIVRSSETTQTTLQVVNPNLFLVAAQYYGDSTRWRQIATASGIVPPDPMPIGQFVLVVPNVTNAQAST